MGSPRTFARYRAAVAVAVTVVLTAGILGVLRYSDDTDDTAVAATDPDDTTTTTAASAVDDTEPEETTTTIVTTTTLPVAPLPPPSYEPAPTIAVPTAPATTPRPTTPPTTRQQPTTTQSQPCPSGRVTLSGVEVVTDSVGSEYGEMFELRLYEVHFTYRNETDREVYITYPTFQLQQGSERWTQEVGGAAYLSPGGTQSDAWFVGSGSSAEPPVNVVGLEPGSALVIWGGPDVVPDTCPGPNVVGVDLPF